MENSGRMGQYIVKMEQCGVNNWTLMSQPVDDSERAVKVRIVKGQLSVIHGT